MIPVAPLSAKRQAHSVSVARFAYRLAGCYGVKPGRAYLAGILHDKARELPDDALVALARSRGHVLSAEEAAAPVLLHGAVAALIAAENYGVRDDGVLDAIRHHTTGGSELSLLAQIVFLADKIEPLRRYDGVEELRALAFTDLRAALCQAVKDEIAYCMQKGVPVHKNTAAMKECFCKGKGEYNVTAWEKALIAKDAIIEKRGREVMALDVAAITEIAELFLLCIAQNRNQARAIANEVADKLEEQGIRPLRLEGMDSAGWVLLDYGDLVVHVFQPEEYAYFNLPRLWKDAEFIEFDDEGNRR